MPNFCSNVLIAAGEPEAVAEFRILNAQHTKRGGSLVLPTGHLSNPLEEITSRPVPSLHRCLVGIRKGADISFCAMTKGEGDASWGTHWDVCDDTHNLKLDRGAWKFSDAGLDLGRLEQWGFTTAWSPPSLWLQSVGLIFTDVRLTLGYAEPGNAEFGVITSHGHQFEHSKMSMPRSEVQPKSIELAISQGRKTMALHRKPNAFLRAIWEDNVEAVESALRRRTVVQMNACISSRWTALMHAAFSGSERVADLLLAAGADPLQGVRLGQNHSFRMADICLDVSPENKPGLVMSRQNILTAAIAINNAVATQPLGTGADALAIAMHFQMGPLIEPLLKHGLLVIQNPDGTDNGVIKGLIMSFNSEAIKGLITLAPPKLVAQFSGQSVIELLSANTNAVGRSIPLSETASDNARLFMHLDDLGHVSNDQMKMASKDLPSKIWGDKSFFVEDNFSASIASERAKRAIDSLFPLQKKPAPAKP